MGIFFFFFCVSKFVTTFGNFLLFFTSFGVHDSIPSSPASGPARCCPVLLVGLVWFKTSNQTASYVAPPSPTLVSLVAGAAASEPKPFVPRKRTTRSAGRAADGTELLVRMGRKQRLRRDDNGRPVWATPRCQPTTRSRSTTTTTRVKGPKRACVYYRPCVRSARVETVINALTGCREMPLEGIICAWSGTLNVTREARMGLRPQHVAGRYT